MIRHSAHTPEECSDCGKKIPAGAALFVDIHDSDYKRCWKCQRHANFNPMNQSATLNPYSY